MKTLKEHLVEHSKRGRDADVSSATLLDTDLTRTGLGSNRNFMLKNYRKTDVRNLQATPSHHEKYRIFIPRNIRNTEHRTLNTELFTVKECTIYNNNH